MADKDIIGKETIRRLAADIAIYLLELSIDPGSPVVVLSSNRDLEEQIQEADKMLTQIDIERLPAYRRVMEKGMEKGEAMFFMRLLDHKFGSIPPVIEQRIENAESEELALWGERVLSAGTLDEVFAVS